MTNKDRKKLAEAYVRLHSDQNMTYTSENGYTGKIYGKSSFVILDKNGACVMHTGVRSFHTFEELKERVDTFPEFLKMLNGKRDCKNCKHHTENGCSNWDCEFEPKER